MKVLIKKLRDDARIPTRAHHDDAGLTCMHVHEHVVAPGETATIPLGVAFEIPLGYVGLIWDKSSIGSKSIKTLCGVIDAGYRGRSKNNASTILALRLIHLNMATKSLRC